jgi:Xaa-Pro aminopeptidase
MENRMSMEVRSAVAARHDRLRARLVERELDAFLSLKLVNTYYLSGFTSLDTARPTTYTRPVAVMIDLAGATIVLPQLDEDAAKATSAIDDIRLYSASPAPVAARKLVLDRLRELGARRIGVEEDSVTGEWVSFLAENGLQWAAAGDAIEELRRVKDDYEIELLRQAGTLSDVAIQASLGSTRAGVPELEAETAGIIAYRAAAASTGSGAVDAISIILSGERGAMPHEFTSARPFGDGDLGWHCWLTCYEGYWTENIRMAVVGDSAGRHERATEVVMEALIAGQDVARPGVRARDVYSAVTDVLNGHGVSGGKVLTRTGHGMGLEYHEPPFNEPGDNTELEVGMVLTIEPGLWIPGVGGATLSNTVVVRENEPEILTPTSLALTCAT